MNISIDTKSRKSVAILTGTDRLTKSGIEFAAYTSGKGLVRTTSKEILRKPKAGKTYFIRDRSGRRRRHVASAPGETHANLTGRLRRTLSFKANVHRIDFGYGVDRNDAPDYAEGLEFGTSKVKPRPSLQNGIRAEQRNFQKNFEREIGKRLEGRTGFIS